MNEKEWEEFWAYLVGEKLIVTNMGSHNKNSVGSYLEWKRQEWLKHHQDCPDCGITKAGREFIKRSKDE